MARSKLPPICETWRAEAKRRKERDESLLGQGERRGISFQLPPGWTDGSGKIRHVTSGIHKGRVCFTSEHEARELAKRYEGISGNRTRFNPD